GRQRFDHGHRHSRGLRNFGYRVHVQCGFLRIRRHKGMPNAYSKAKALPKMYRQIWAKMAGICRWCAKCPQNRTLGDAFEKEQSLALGELADRLEAFRLQRRYRPARALIVRIRRLPAAKQPA